MEELLGRKKVSGNLALRLKHSVSCVTTKTNDPFVDEYLRA